MGREYMTVGQFLAVKVKIPTCSANPNWDAWESKTHGLELPNTLQKATIEALTTFCGQHSAFVARTAAKVIPLHEQHPGQWIEREALVTVQYNSHYNHDLVTSVHFSKAMYNTYQLIVREKYDV